MLTSLSNWSSPPAKPDRPTPATPSAPAEDDSQPPGKHAVRGAAAEYGMAVILLVVLDLSGSVFAEQERIEGLYREMLEEIRSDTLAAVSVRVALLTFSSTVDVTPFAAAENAIAPGLTFGGSTEFWAAMKKACELVTAEVARANEAGESIQKIIVPVISDFEPTDTPGDTLKLLLRTQSTTRMNLLPIAAGANPNMGLARSLTKSGRAIRMDEAKVREMFRFISASAVMASRSQPGQAITVATDELAKFARLD